ncbi:Hypothetical protein R9X50_00481900 [Acrodontium crateriforme]|uniref:Serine/threonine-protein kinase Tel1 n=1 Tax=Acrodontium crateriforme TaxID=150365 RepID=A0AAQ3RB30_9PEZI|nr:Hypothetical protein R9X50_00481900 [Acrodontium crateriforme]
MGGLITIWTTLDKLKASTGKIRSDGLTDLKNLLQNDQKSSESLGDDGYHILFEELFQLAVTRQSTWLKAQSSTRPTKSGSDDLLSTSAEALRTAVESGAPNIKLKTVKAVIDHVIGTVILSSGGFCTPLVLGYAKSIRSLLAYQPHVEHLPKAEWESTAMFCVEMLRLAEVEAGGGHDAVARAETASMALSHISSRSYARDSAGSQANRSLAKQVAEEIVGTLSLLTAAPNATVPTKASELLWALLGFLKGRIFAASSHQDAFSAINNILSWIRIEKILLTKQATSHIIRLIKVSWTARTVPAVKDEMLITMHYLLPFLSQAVKQYEDIPLRKELGGLVDVLQTEYSSPSRKILNHMHLEDLRLTIYQERIPETGDIATPIFQLRNTGIKAEHNWMLVYTLASFYHILLSDTNTALSSDYAKEHYELDGPRKRQRLVDGFQDLLSSTNSGSPNSRICALQTVQFLAQQMLFSVKQLASAVDILMLSCSEDNSSITSWSLLAIASCASQASSSNSSLSAHWSAVWQLANRAVGNPASCRAACHVLSILQQARLVPRASLTELGQILTSSMDLNGPSVLADSVSYMLRLALRDSQQLSPATTSAMAESILGWILRIFLPSRFEDRNYALSSVQYEASDITSIISTCLNHDTPNRSSFRFQPWGPVGQVWLLCQAQKPLVSYLLLLPEEKSPLHASLHRTNANSHVCTSKSPPRLNCETLVLNHLTSELQRTIDLWGQYSNKNVNIDMFKSLCLACTIICNISHENEFRDMRRISHIQKQSLKLLHGLRRFASDPICDQSKVDWFISSLSQTFTGLRNLDHHSQTSISECEKILCTAISDAISQRRWQMDHSDQDDDDGMDLDDDFDSQESRRQGHSQRNAVGFKNDYAVAYSNQTVRETVTMYATIVRILHSSSSPGSESVSPSKKIVDYILALPEASILSSRTIIASLPQHGLLLSADEAEKLLAFCADNILGAYLYERSETAIGAILDIMSSLTPVLTDKQNQSLFDLGIDIYDWFTTRALTGGVLSPNVQKRVARLLLQLCHVNTDYGTESDVPVPSVRTSLFKLLQHGNISVLFYVADRISSIFGLFVLSTHGRMFDDLNSSLPSELDWLEGIAMRLLFLAKLASAWHSLLRQCTYYIFESAGLATASGPYAARCITELTTSLKFPSPQKLFRLFAPQLLYTWLESDKLAKIPYATFQYHSLYDLLAQNQVEIIAQLVMRGSEENIQTMAKVLKTPIKDLARGAFAKSLAYALCWDVTAPKPDNGAPTSEARLRSLVGSKEEFKKLIVEQFPHTMGHLYISMQNSSENVDDKWLEKRSQYAFAAKALEEMKSYSHSTRDLPIGPQPSFKPKFLCDEIERLCRRSGHDPLHPWTSSSFSLAARMLLDAIDNSLGPLHICSMLRKLRILVCMAGDTALSGFPLEMLIHSIRSFLSDSECADDAIGILHYLLERGNRYIITNNLPFAYGTVTLMILQMKQHSNIKQDTTTQESQHQATVQRMQKFQSWLVHHLRSFDISTDKSASDTYAILTESLGSVNLPGNARTESPESSVLLLLLAQRRGPGRVLLKSDCNEALTIIARNFIPPVSLLEDCLGSDHAAVEYADYLWDILRISTLDGNFILWAAAAIGRAYVSTGKRPQRMIDEGDNIINLPVSSDGIKRSQSTIASRLSDLVSSRDRTEAGLADFTLRKAVVTLKSEDDILSFEQMLPGQLVAAIAEGNYGFEPAVVTFTTPSSVTETQLERAMDVSLTRTDEEWMMTLAITICQWSSGASILPALPAILENVSGLATDLLPPIIHIVLAEESDKKQVLRSTLSRAMISHFTSNDEALRTRKQFFLRLLLYLKSQPIPGEATNVDRWRWMEVDLVLAAKTAADCNMPTAALLLAESATTITAPNRRVSSRTSFSQVEPAQIPDELLISIFKQVDEPDSFYGVQQPSSLENVLSRLDYEENGMKSLMFRSAQMDSVMRSTHKGEPSDAVAMVRSLSVLNLNSLTFTLLSGAMGNASGSSKEMLNTARSLQQWDLIPAQSDSGAAAMSFTVFQELSRSTTTAEFNDKLRKMLARHVQPDNGQQLSDNPSYSWCNTLANFTEVSEIVGFASERRLQSCWNNMLTRQQWTKSSPYEDSGAILINRQTLFSVLAQNKALMDEMHLSPKTCKKIEAESLLEVSKYARSHGVIQEALSATTQVSLLANQDAHYGVHIDAAAKVETASVLWDIGEATASVLMLRDILDIRGLEVQDIPVGRSGLLAQLAHQLAEARLEKPDEILENYLKPAIEKLQKRDSGHEAGNVFHEFASFCDQQLQSPGNIEDFSRIAKLRQKKADEVQALEALAKSTKKSGDDKRSLERSIRQARQWYEIDDIEYQRLKSARDTFVQQSLQNYMLALHASDEHDICVLRFFALWLENSDVPAANNIVSEHLGLVPSWKFVVLLNQLMSRLETDENAFQTSLKKLAQRLCSDHPYHSLHHLYASTRKPAKGGPAYSRYEAAMAIRAILTADAKGGERLKRMFLANGNYNFLAQSEIPGGAQSKMNLKDFPAAVKVASKIPDLRVPPATITLPLQPDGNYSNVPTITKFSSTLSVMTGLSKPKALTAYATDGKSYKQLFKGGNDDLRQDAIMEQVFEEVSKMLQNHKATRKRDLHVRTYKVIPLSSHSGIMEFVASSIPINDFLEPAHLRYNPHDMKPHTARQRLAALKDHAPNVRVKEYRKICDQLHPVLRHFFFERYQSPEEWFEKRTAYTRTTAAISILGYILGLGDRHCHNILLDEKSGEVVHIDLGVAFEAGRVLPVPELVPFRLTRDIVDGMGATKTEGIFRRCCEFTLEALREDKDGIMTLLNVLRYDPLYSWTVSPLRAKRMQDAQETARNGAVDEESSKKKEQEAGEAERALSIVEKKLSKTLSTAAAVNELIQQATDERNLGTLFQGWAAYL